MAQTYVIEITPAGDPHHDEFDAFLAERRLCCSWTPFIAAARVLLSEGASPGALAIMRHRGSEHDSLRGKLGAVAKLAVSGGYFKPDPGYEDPS
jgi:hypothetical protein